MFTIIDKIKGVSLDTNESNFKIMVLDMVDNHNFTENGYKRIASAIINNQVAIIDYAK